MKLNVRHTFACTPDEFWSMFWDPAFDDEIMKRAKVNRDVLDDRTLPDGVRFQRFRFVPERTLPGPVARLVGGDRLTYEQENQFDPKTGILSWKVLPAVLPDKITAEGTLVVKPAAGGCERIVEGRIEVRVPLVGGRIESAIVSDVEASYERAAEVTREWIAKGGKA